MQEKLLNLSVTFPASGTQSEPDLREQIMHQSVSYFCGNSRVNHPLLLAVAIA